MLFRLSCEKGEVTALDGKRGFVSTVQAPGEFLVPLTTPRGTVQEVVLLRNHLVAHEPVRTGDALTGNLSDEYTLGRQPSDLEKVDVGLIVAPRHTEDGADFDFGIRCSVIVHCEDMVNQFVANVKP